MLCSGDRIEVTTHWPYYLHSVSSLNTKLYLRLVGCRGTIKKSFVTWDGVPYVNVSMDLDPNCSYQFGYEWCRRLSALESLAEQAE